MLGDAASVFDQSIGSARFARGVARAPSRTVVAARTSKPRDALGDARPRRAFRAETDFQQHKRIARALDECGQQTLPRVDAKEAFFPCAVHADPAGMAKSPFNHAMGELPSRKRACALWPAAVVVVCVFCFVVVFVV